MEAWAFFKKPEKTDEPWYLKGLYKSEEKARRRLIYEEGKVKKITDMPLSFKKYTA